MEGNQSDYGRFYKWSFSNVVRVPARLLRMPGFPFKEGELVEVTLDAKNKMLIITQVKKVSKHEVKR